MKSELIHFITSILRSAAADGDPIAAFETNLPEPGNQTWLGTQGGDVLDARIEFANGDEAGSLFGGDGAMYFADIATAS